VWINALVELLCSYDKLSSFLPHPLQAKQAVVINLLLLKILGMYYQHLIDSKYICFCFSYRLIMFYQTTTNQGQCNRVLSGAVSPVSVFIFSLCIECVFLGHHKLGQHLLTAGYLTTAALGVFEFSPI